MNNHIELSDREVFKTAQDRQVTVVELRTPFNSTQMAFFREYYRIKLSFNAAKWFLVLSAAFQND